MFFLLYDPYLEQAKDRLVREVLNLIRGQYRRSSPVIAVSGQQSGQRRCADTWRERGTRQMGKA